MGRRRMLTPWCARESAEQPVLDLERDPADWCDAATPGHVTRTGRGRAALGDLDRFASRLSGRIDDGEEITLLEPDLARRFRRGLLFRGEVNLDQRPVMAAFRDRLSAMGRRIPLRRRLGLRSRRFAVLTGRPGLEKHRMRQQQRESQSDAPAARE